MYIISKFKDYYDIGASVGVDKSIVYERKFIDLKNRNITMPSGGALMGRKHFDRRDMDKHQYDAPYCYSVELAVCGKAIILYYVPEKKSHSTHALYECETYKVFDTKEDAFVYSKENDILGSMGFFSRYIDSDDDEHMITDDDAMEYNIEHSSPIVDITNNIVNPTLNNYELYRFIDPYTMFQDIQMFISGVLTTSNEKPETPMTEKQKVSSKGMDEWSFRKLPSKGKR